MANNCGRAETLKTRIHNALHEMIYRNSDDSESTEEELPRQMRTLDKKLSVSLFELRRMIPKNSNASDQTTK